MVFFIELCLNHKLATIVRPCSKVLALFFIDVQFELQNFTIHGMECFVMNINIFMMFATLPPLCRYSKFVRLGKYAVRTPATRTMTGEYCHECGGGKLVVFINTLRPRQDGRHFPDDILKWIFLNENL